MSEECPRGPVERIVRRHDADAKHRTWAREQASCRPEIFRHKKTGGIYAVICNAARESDGVLMIVYRNVVTGDRWIRPAAEFNDGRFEAMG